MSYALLFCITLQQLGCKITDKVLDGQCEGAAAVERLPKRSYPAGPRSG